ncbi:MAG: DUF3352 domain-containing protein, partial [Candidatus Electrothrix sp. ATG1]|nr:DUF3352 domain-containing protein [Candidatus Electrothrix sp. ATG1]
RLNDKEILYGHDAQGIIVLAYEPNRIVQAVQQKTATNNLQHFSSFTKAKAFWQEAGQQEHVYARSYFNATLLHKLLNTLDNRKMQEMIEKLAGVKSIGGLIVQNHGKLRLQMETERDSSLNENTLKNETVLAHENLTSPLLQKTTLLHYRTSGFNKTFFRNFLPSAERKQQYRKLEKSVQNELGFSLDKFLEAIGPRTEISVHEIINAGMFPLPKTVLAFQVQDRKAAGWALERLRDTLKKQGVANEHQERVQGHDLYYWTVMPVEATHLAIVLTDTMLYIANGESQLRALLSEKKNSEPSKIVGDCITTANAGAFLFRPARFADQIAPVADWLTDMMLARGTGPGKKTQKEVLTLMRSFDRITACSHRTATGSRGEVVFKVFS